MVGERRRTHGSGRARYMAERQALEQLDKTGEENRGPSTVRNVRTRHQRGTTKGPKKTGKGSQEAKLEEKRPKKTQRNERGPS